MLYFPIGTCRHLQPYKPTIVIFPSHVFIYCVSFVSPKCSLPSPLPHIVSVCCKNATIKWAAHATAADRRAAAWTEDQIEDQIVVAPCRHALGAIYSSLAAPISAPQCSEFTPTGSDGGRCKRLSATCGDTTAASGVQDGHARVFRWASVFTVD